MDLSFHFYPRITQIFIYKECKSATDQCFPYCHRPYTEQSVRLPLLFAYSTSYQRVLTSNWIGERYRRRAPPEQLSYYPQHLRRL